MRSILLTFILFFNFQSFAQEGAPVSNQPSDSGVAQSPQNKEADESAYPGLRVSMATARIQALTAAIQFHAIRQILNNPNNSAAVIEVLSRTLNTLTQEQRPASSANTPSEASLTPTVAPISSENPPAEPAPAQPASVPEPSPKVP